MKMLKGDPAGAGEIAQKMLDDPKADHAGAHYVLARVDMMDRQPEEAVAEFNQVLQTSKDPRTLAWSHIYMGRLYDVMETPERQKAIEEYKAALTVRDSQPDTKAAAEAGIKAPFALPKREHPASAEPDDDAPLDPAARLRKKPTVLRRSKVETGKRPELEARGTRMTTRRNQTGHRRPQPQAPSASGALSDHAFESPELLTRALTHRSLAYETDPEALNDPGADNEQLEFIGDAVLGLVVAEALLRSFPGSHEGELTRLRASLVSRGHLGKVAARIDLGAQIRLGRGEEHSGGRHKEAILANALEAVIAAIYLDGGLQPAKDFIERHIVEPALPDLRLAIRSGDTFSGAIGDYKSALQEHLQAMGAGQPEYVLTAQTGPDHQKRFPRRGACQRRRGWHAGAGRVGGLDQEAGPAGGGKDGLRSTACREAGR